MTTYSEVAWWVKRNSDLSDDKVECPLKVGINVETHKPRLFCSYIYLYVAQITKYSSLIY